MKDSSTFDPPSVLLATLDECLWLELVFGPGKLSSPPMLSLMRHDWHLKTCLSIEAKIKGFTRRTYIYSPLQQHVCCCVAPYKVHCIHAHQVSQKCRLLLCKMGSAFCEPTTAGLRPRRPRAPLYGFQKSSSEEQYWFRTSSESGK